MTTMRGSVAEQLAALPADERAVVLAALSDDELDALAYDWSFWGRPDQQLPPGEWATWLILAGRGWGKTRTGAETVRSIVDAGGNRGALVAATAADARDVVIEGESGLLAVFPTHQRPVYEPSKRRITFHTGAIATLYSADEPERLRGPQHEYAWADELAAWRYPDAWDQLQLGLRLGANPRAIVTTTPKPKKIIRELLADKATIVTTGSTYDNQANLAERFISQIIAKYEGTTLGQQELHAVLLDEASGAPWTRDLIDSVRVPKIPPGVDIVRFGVAVDPAVTNNKHSDETGIIAGFLGDDDHVYIVEDASLHGSPDEWAQRAINTYHRHDADRLIGEVNNGGDLIETVIRQKDRNISYKAVRASKGKYTRSEPVVALYEQGRVHHVGVFPELEDQMVTWTVDADFSPDRMDALVWLVTELVLGKSEPRVRGL
jgi:phage terminase large subunit-like protein